jgi:hypothetical protein
LTIGNTAIRKSSTGANCRSDGASFADATITRRKNLGT